MSRRSGLWIVLAAAVVIRCIVVVPSLRDGLDDPDNYLPLARSLAEGMGFRINGKPTAYRPPLYPLALAPIVGTLGDRWSWGVAALHVGLGVGTVLLTYLAARRWGADDARSLLAAAIVACDPVLAAQAKSVMTETLAAFLTAATIAALADPRPRLAAILGGLGFGLGGLCRPSLLFGAALTTLALLMTGPGGRRSRIERACLLVLTALLTLSPWAVRNARIFGEPVWTTTHGGYTLALANNATYYDEVLDGPRGAVWTGRNQWLWWDGVNTRTKGMSEPEADRSLRDEALVLIRERPAAFARASLARLGRFWAIAPSGSVYPARLRLATALWTIPLWVALGSGLACRDLRRWPGVSALLIVLGLSCVHAFYWTDLRMRAPVVPAIALVAASGFRLRSNRV